MKDTLKYNESIKFSSFENENSFGLFLTPEPRIFIDFLINLINIYLSNLIDDQTNRVQARNNYNQINFVGEEIQSPLLDRRNCGLSAKSLIGSLMQNERGNEIRNSKKHRIINLRNNFDKRKKFKIINKIKIKNNLNNFKKKYR